MKVLHLSTTDIRGGAGIAAFRLHRGLVDSGIESLMYVQRKYGQDDLVHCSQNKMKRFFGYFCAASDKIIASIFGPKSYEIVSPALFSSFDSSLIDKINPDVVHLHWICGGFMSPRKISKINKPIVWTMHDAWPFSGVNHYNADQQAYITGDFKNENYLDKLTWLRKKKAWTNLINFTAAAPSKWLAESACSSNLFRKMKIQNLPNGIDVNVFKKYDKINSRSQFNLPVDKKILLFGAVDPLSGERKGYKLLIKIIDSIAHSQEKDIVVAIFGASPSDKINFSLPTYFLGKINSEIDLAKAYSAADIFIAPSIEDNLPNTVLESMSCGTPVAAFKIGGMSDMIDHKQNGLLIEPFDIKLFSQELIVALTQDDYYHNLSVSARKKVLENFDIKIAVDNYIKLYKSIISV